MNTQNTASALPMYDEYKSQGGDVKALAENIGTRFELPNGMMNSVAMVESGFKTGAKNPESTATGVYQFTDGTWNDMMARYGTQFNIPKGTRADDPVANTLLGAQYLKDNANNFKSTFNRDPELVDVYMGHLFGPSGRNNFISNMDKNPNAPVDTYLSPKVFNSNKQLFTDKSGRVLTGAEVRSRLANKLDAHVDGNPLLDRDKTLPTQAAANVQDEGLRIALEGDDGSISGAQANSSAATSMDILGIGKAESFTKMPERAEVPEEKGIFDGMGKSLLESAKISPTSRYAQQVLHSFGIDLNDYDADTERLVEGIYGLAPVIQDDTKQMHKPMQFTAEQMELLKKSVPARWVDYVAEARNIDDLKWRTQNAKKWQAAVDERKTTGIGSQLVGQFSEDLNSPLTFLGFGMGSALTGGASVAKGGYHTAKQIGKAGVIASSTALMEEYAKDITTKGGLETDYIGAAAGGFVFGGFLKGAAMGIDHLRGSNRAYQKSKAYTEGAEVDPTARPDIEVPEGKSYVDHPTEEGAVVLPDGTVHSKTSLLNTKTLDTVMEFEDPLGAPVRWSAPLGPLDSTAKVLLESEHSPFFTKWVRSPVGYQGTGYTGNAAEDITVRLQSRDNSVVTNMVNTEGELYRNGGYHAQGLDAEYMQRKITEAREAKDLSRLSPEEAEYAQVVSDFYKRKLDEATNMSQHGNGDNIEPVLDSSIDGESYFSVLYAERKVDDHKMRFDGSEGLHKELQNGVMQSYDANPEIRSKWKQAFDADQSPEAEAFRKQLKDPKLDVTPEGKTQTVRESKLEAANTKLAAAEKIAANNHLKASKARKDSTRTKYQQTAARYDAIAEKHRKEIAKLTPKSEDDVIRAYAEDSYRKSTYGISFQNDFSFGAAMENIRSADALSGLQNKDYKKHRMIADYAFTWTASDGKSMSLNDLRVFDIPTISRAYSRSLNGEIGLHAGLGMNTRDVLDKIARMPDGRVKEAAQALAMDTLGRPRAEISGGAFAQSAKILQELTMGARGQNMWMNGIPEASGVHVNRLMGLLRGGVPALKHMMNPAAKFTKEDLRQIRSMMYGEDVINNLRPSYKYMKESMMSRGVGEKTATVLAGARKVTGTLANTPLIRLMPKMAQAFIDKAQVGVYLDVVDEAMLGIKRLHPKALELASISPQQYERMLNMIRKHTRIEDGHYVSDLEALRVHPDMANLWRLSDNVATDCVVRTNRVGTNYVTNPNPALDLALQFKSFFFKGLNQRTTKFFQDTFKYGKGLDNTMRFGLSLGLAAATFTGKVWHNSTKLPEHKREEYLERNLQPEVVVWQALSGSPELGPLLGLINFGASLFSDSELFTAGRTTLSADPTGKSAFKSGALSQKQAERNLSEKVASIFPSWGVASSIYGASQNAAGLITAEEGYEADTYKAGFFDNAKGVVSNDIATQMLIEYLSEQSGSADKRMLN